MTAYRFSEFDGGGMGYWNKIRRDFPDAFARMAALEVELGATVLRSKGEPLPLHQLDPDRGNHADEPDFECSLMCAMAEDVVTEHLRDEAAVLIERSGL